MSAEVTTNTPSGARVPTITDRRPKDCYPQSGGDDTTNTDASTAKPTPYGRQGGDR